MTTPTYPEGRLPEYWNDLQPRLPQFVFHRVTFKIDIGLTWEVECLHPPIPEPYCCDEYMFHQDGESWLESTKDEPFDITGPLLVKSWWTSGEDSDWCWSLATSEEAASVRNALSDTMKGTPAVPESDHPESLLPEHLPFPPQFHQVTLRVDDGLKWTVKCFHAPAPEPHPCHESMFGMDGSSEWMECSQGESFEINGPFLVKSWWDSGEDPEWSWRLATVEEYVIDVIGE